MANYYRITAYHPQEDYSFIADSHGKFEKLWQFSAYLVSKGLKILEVSNSDNFQDGNIPRGAETTDWLYIMACTHGKPTISNGTIHMAGRYYVPQKEA